MNNLRDLIKTAAFVAAIAVLSGCMQSSLVLPALPRGSKLVTPPGDPNPALCCGSCNGTTCQDCAQMSPLATCNGIVLACPKGEVITSEGEGSCVDD